MTFLIDEKVSCIIMCSNPLVTEESHCTASFRGVRGCCLNLLVCTHKNGQNKTNPKEGGQKEMNQGDFVKKASKWGDASKVESH